MVVSMSLAFTHSFAQEGQDCRLGILHARLPHITATHGVWKKWMDKVVGQLTSIDDETLPRLTVDEDAYGEDALHSDTERALLFKVVISIIGRCTLVLV